MESIVAIGTVLGFVFIKRISVLGREEAEFNSTSSLHVLGDFFVLNDIILPVLLRVDVLLIFGIAITIEEFTAIACGTIGKLWINEASDFGLGTFDAFLFGTDTADVGENACCFHVGVSGANVLLTGFGVLRGRLSAFAIFHEEPDVVVAVAGSFGRTNSEESAHFGANLSRQDVYCGHVFNLLQCCLNLIHFVVSELGAHDTGKGVEVFV